MFEYREMTDALEKLSNKSDLSDEVKSLIKAFGKYASKVEERLRDVEAATAKARAEAQRR